MGYTFTQNHYTRVQVTIAFFFLKTKVIPCNFINPSASQIYPRHQTTTQIYPRLSSPQKPDSKIFILKNSYTFQIFLHNVLFILLFLNILNQLLSGSNFTPGGCIFLYLDQETIHFEYPSRPPLATITSQLQPRS